MGAVATLQRVADEGGMPIQHGQRLEVVVPANKDKGHYFTVAAGHWLVEATLPSGEVVTEEVFVRTGHDAKLTLSSAERAPHPWLGWQHLVGNIEGAETLQRLRPSALEAIQTKAEMHGAVADAAGRTHCAQDLCYRRSWLSEK